MEKEYKLICRDGSITIDKSFIEKSDVLKNCFYNENFGKTTFYKINHSVQNVNKLIDYINGMDLNEKDYLGMFYVYDELCFESNFNCDNHCIMITKSEYDKMIESFNVKKFLQILYDNDNFLNSLYKKETELSEHPFSFTGRKEYKNIYNFTKDEIKLESVKKIIDDVKNKKITDKYDSSNQYNFSLYIDSAIRYYFYLNNDAFLSIEKNDDTFMTYLSYIGIDFYMNSENEKYMLFKRNKGQFKCYNKNKSFSDLYNDTEKVYGKNS